MLMTVILDSPISRRMKFLAATGHIYVVNRKDYKFLKLHDKFEATLFNKIKVDYVLTDVDAVI